MEKIYYLILAIFYFVIGVYSSLFFIVKKNISKALHKRFLFLFGIIGIAFFIKSTLYFLSFFGKINLDLRDLSLINPLLLFIVTSVLVLLLSILKNNPNLKFFLFFYLFSFFSFIFSGTFDILFYVISFIILSIIFLSFLVKKEFKKVSLFGLVYSFILLFLFILFKIGIENLFLFEFITSFFFFLFLINLFKSIDKKGYDLFFNKKGLKHSSIVLDFLKYFLFVILLMFFIFISTVTIHELGHFTVSKFFDCSFSKIIYSGDLPHTEILCQNQDSTSLLYSILGGLFFPLLIALLFFLVGGKFMVEIGLSIFGFDLLLAYEDFIELGFTSTQSLFFGFLGLLLLILAIALLANSRVEEKSFLYLLDGEKAFYTNKPFTLGRKKENR